MNNIILKSVSSIWTFSMKSNFFWLGEGQEILAPTLVTRFPIPSFQISCMGVINKTVVVVGDGGCGKTSLLLMLSQKQFPEDSPPTSFKTYTANIKVDGKQFEFTCVDTGGEYWEVSRVACS